MAVVDASKTGPGDPDSGHYVEIGEISVPGMQKLVGVRFRKEDMIPMMSQDGTVEMLAIALTSRDAEHFAKEIIDTANIVSGENN